MISRLMFILALLLISCEAASSKCLSRSEARAAYPRAYLTWARVKGQRCWDDRRPRRRVMSGRELMMASVPPTITQEPIHQEPALAWQPQWSWVFTQNYAREEETAELPFSTFAPEQEPDTWPRLEPKETNSGGMFVVLIFAIMALVFGTMFQRWHSSRVRITRALL